jgi:hypothetical protein
MRSTIGPCHNFQTVAQNGQALANALTSIGLAMRGGSSFSQEVS